MGRRFPIVGERKLNLGSGSDVRPAAEGWTNLDAYYEHREVVRHDLAQFPYPFATHTFDAVYAHHVLEHIPLLFEERKGIRRDVLFSLMEEIHRILKPGGRFHIVVPFGATPEGTNHPQHYRQWRPEWFQFFCATEGEPTGYHGARFHLERLRYNRSGVRFPYFLPLGRLRMGLAWHLVERVPRLVGWLLQPRHEIEAILVAGK